jgi:hypothetical protein
MRPNPALQKLLRDMQSRNWVCQTDFGQEWDVVIGIEEWEHLELELVGAVFRAGNAYGSRSGEQASALIFKLNYNF